MVETAIMSVLEQDYPSLEVIAVDDGSRDETPALLERIGKHADPERFRWSVQENAGQAATLNRTWAESRGELLGYVSSDDYLLPGAITKLVAASQEHPEADVFYPWELIVDETDRTIDVLEHLTFRYIDAVRWAQCSIGVGALVRRSRFEMTGGWDTTLRLIPDFDWWLRMHDATFVCVPEALGARRRHAGSIGVGMDAFEDMREWLLVLDRVFARDDLPNDVRAVKNQAYAAALMHTVHQLQIRDPLQPTDARFEIQDTISPRYAMQHRTLVAAERAAILASMRDQQVQLRAQETMLAELRQTVDALHETARLKDAEREVLLAERGSLAAHVHVRPARKAGEIAARVRGRAASEARQIASRAKRRFASSR
jgi:GT2 family glycosyltransferase